MGWGMFGGEVSTWTVELLYDFVLNWFFFFSSRRRHTRYWRDWSSDVCSSDLFREADAALIYAMGGKINDKNPVGMVNVGFRTTELSYFDKGFKFNDKLSTTIESGNQNALKLVQKRLVEQGITKSLPEIDTADDYPELKELAYTLTSDDTNEIIEETWNNLDEMDIYVSGGTSLNLKLDDKFTVVEDSQMATARGLYEVGVRLEK